MWYIYTYTYQIGGTKFLLLESFTKHPSRSAADHIFKSVLCGRCGTVNYHPLLNLWDFKAFGGWKCDQGTTKLHARILTGKGVRKKKPNMFTVGSSTSATFVLPVFLFTGNIITAPRHGMASNITNSHVRYVTKGLSQVYCHSASLNLGAYILVKLVASSSHAPLCCGFPTPAIR